MMSRGWREGFTLIVLALCSQNLISAQVTDHLRPHFVDYMDENTLNQLYGSSGGGYVNALDAGLSLPLVTPPDGYQFAVMLGETHSFFVVGQWDDGDEPVGTGLSLGVLFEEPASLWQGDPQCQTTPQSMRKCVTSPAPWCACEALETELPDGRLANKVFSDAFPNDNRRFGKYTFTARRWRPREELRVCFRVMDCNPSAAQGDAQACVLDPAGAFDERFYPQRCVFVSVLQPPAIVSVHPLDPSHRVAGTEGVAPPVQPWYGNVTTVDARVAAGELVRVAVDAWDVNEEDDVDVRLAPASQPLPPGAALGPRMCCDAEFEECEERAAGAAECEEECAADCTHVTVLNQSVDAECRPVCRQRCTPRPCRYVRRVLQYLGPATTMAGLQFEAFDDSHRLNRFSQTERRSYPAPPACCNASSLVSPPSPPVSVSVVAGAPAFAFPSPIDGTVVKATVGCPMRALAVYAVSPDAASDLLPEGCEPGSFVRSQVCLEEACSERTDCCCATPPRVCALCLPQTPDGMEVSGPMPYSLLLQPLAPGAGRVEAFHVLGATAEVVAEGAGAVWVLRVRASAVVPHGTTVALTGLRPANASLLSTPWPTRKEDVHVMGGMAGDSVEVEEWDGATGALAVRVHRRGPASREVELRWRVDPMLEVNMTGVTVRLDGRGVDTARDIAVSTMAVGVAGCLNCTAGLMGEGSHGAGSMRVVRWTPGVEEMGRVLHVCFKALGANTTEGVVASAEQRCLRIEVERCRYCVGEGETLESIAHALGTDWLQIWSANAMMGVPVDGVGAGAVVQVGPVHRVPETAKLGAVAVRLATTEASLRSVNRDIPPEQMWVAAGRELCVLTGVCDTDVAADGSGLYGVANAMPEEA